MSGRVGAVQVADAFGAYTAEAEFYEVPYGELEEFLSPFAGGLLGAAGRMLAVLAYRDAARYGDVPVDRAASGVRETVLFLLPEGCDGRDRAFRMGVARAFGDLAEDLARGRAPVPRCGAEAWALEQMLMLASRVCAATDAELELLGVGVPGHGEEYRPAYWEDAWQLRVESAQHSIPEARGDHTADNDDGEEPEEIPEPEQGWDSAEFWFSPYGFIAARDPERGHPQWALAHLDGASMAPDELPSVERIAAIMRLGTSATGFEAYEGRAEYEDLAEVLTPLGARLLAAAADRVAERGYHELLHYGDRVFDRPSDKDAWRYHDSFLMQLPAICDGASAAWRLAMVRAVDDLAGDLRAGRAPLPRCPAEEMAFYFVRCEAELLLELLGDDPDLADDYGLPPADAFTARHCPVDLWREAFLQDEDILFHFDQDLAHVAADPGHPASRQLGTGDLRPNAWFVCFGNLRPRDPARGYPPHIITLLTSADADAFFASTPALTSLPGEPAGDPALRDEFETLVGYTQRRFLDESTAVAMAVGIERLLGTLLEIPADSLRTVWPQHDRATAAHAGSLLVDRDFSIRGRHHDWRLRADQGEQHARTWTLKLLDDCAALALDHFAGPRSPYEAHRPEPARPAPGIKDRLAARLTVLSRPDTACGTLLHQLTAHGMTAADLAAGAILPEALMKGWLDGTTAISPGQLVRCAPVLQMPEDTLLACLGGGRARFYWPLPQPDTDQVSS
ncbi:hypothetical protein [Streptomyces sp. NPDC059816]|uniref:hypothetical protein n=1 Tax=Streptomyces sp. NPDC059816 TaxID=3346960 RepID=UPI00366564D0